MGKFGRRLRSLRGQRSQAEIAKALGMPITTLSTLENQDSVPRGDVLQKFAEFYKVPIAYFYRANPGGLKASDAARAWLRQLRESAGGRDTVATQANLHLDERMLEKIAKKIRKRHAEVSADG